jgi:hypothetical protein
MPRKLAVTGLGLVAALFLGLTIAPAGGATAAYTVYSDTLAPGWTNWSWDSTVDFGAASPVYSGTNAIAWTVTAAWGGLYLHNDVGVPSSPFVTLSFALRATQAGQRVSVVLEDVHDNPLGPVVKLTSSYGGQPVAGSWKLYSIPLTALGGVNKTVGGIIIQDESGRAEPPLYVDAIQLTTNTTPQATATAPTTPTPIATVTTTPTVTATKPPTATVTSTPAATASPTPTASPSSTPSPSPSPVSSTYPWHTNIVSTTFWVGEMFNANLSDGSQACSTYDSQWDLHYSGVATQQLPATAAGCAGSYAGGCDGVWSSGTCTTEVRTAGNGYFPSAMTPLENPFYLDLPFDDVNDATAFAERCQVIPWARQIDPTGAHCSDPGFSYMKNHWVQIVGPNGHTCYGQVEDAGPSHGTLYHDATYVFGSTDARPIQGQFNDAGMDVSPALNGCLGYAELDGDNDHINWRFIDDQNVPAGPWKSLITTSGVME